MTQELKPLSLGGPPNLRESSDYGKEPFAPRCFNCMYLRDENLRFYCSKFMAKVNVYQLCDDWKAVQDEDLIIH